MNIKYIISLFALVALTGASCWSQKMSEADADELLFKAANSGSMSKLLKAIENDADIDASDIYESGDTALILAAEEGHLDVVTELLRSKASINKANNDGFTALMYASRNGHEHVVAELLKQGFIYINENNNGQSPLKLAIQGNHKGIAHKLLEKGVKTTNLSDNQKEKLEKWGLLANG